MIQLRFLTVVSSLLLVFPLVGTALAQGTTPAAPAHGVPCGPDHQILYKRAVTLLDDAEKKLFIGYRVIPRTATKAPV